MKPDGETFLQRLGSRAFFAGLALIIIGMILTVFGVVTQGSSSATTSFGGVIFVGPFPIVFGAGPLSPFLIAAGLVIAVITVLLAFLMCRQSAPPQEEEPL